MRASLLVLTAILCCAAPATTQETEAQPPPRCIFVPNGYSPKLSASEAVRIAAASTRIAHAEVVVSEVRHLAYVTDGKELGSLLPDFGTQPQYPSWIVLAKGRFTVRRTNEVNDFADRAYIFVSESPEQAYAIRFATHLNPCDILGVVGVRCGRRNLLERPCW